MVDAVFMAAYVPQGELDEVSLGKAKSHATGLLEKILFQIGQNSDKIVQVSNMAQLRRAKDEGRQAFFLAIENGYAIANDIDNIDFFNNMGVKYITLCHNGDNLIADSALRSKSTNGGLSSFGKEVVKRMNKLGILVDISHAADSTIDDVLNISSKPIVATHSCCRALCDHPRNLTDRHIKAIAQNGGVVQICIYRYFLSKKESVSVKDIVAHVNHVVRLVGVDNVGIGSDFDGGGGIEGCMAENEMINITKALIAEGYSDIDIFKIMGGNFIRLLE